MSRVIRALSGADLAAARAFLEARADTSLFLLGNLASLGPTLGEDPRSGNFKLIEEEGGIVAVFCLTRMGNLLLQTGGRTELAAEILEACRDEPMAVCGVAGEWLTAHAVWQQLLTEPGFVPMHGTREVLYVLEQPEPVPASADIEVRRLSARDFAAWDALNGAFCTETQLPREADIRARRTRFVGGAAQGLWWGAARGADLVAIAALNAVYGAMGQVGGVYTHAGHRRQGVAGALMRQLISDAVQVHRLGRLSLFTQEDNRAARRLYESLGFEERGDFGLLLGTRGAAR
jgi:predicted GNAT family acetyltransferase